MNRLQFYKLSLKYKLYYCEVLKHDLEEWIKILTNGSEISLFFCLSLTVRSEVDELFISFANALD